MKSLLLRLILAAVLMAGHEAAAFDVLTVPLPTAPPDLVLKCKWFVDITGVYTHTIRVWNSGAVALDERVHPATVGFSEIVFTDMRGVMSDSRLRWDSADERPADAA